jgi:Alpha/beta hydrolase family
MATFVLVHGASLGGWCWRGVADLLQARGHSVQSATLTGMGERRHLPVAGVEAHVTDIAAMLIYRDLWSVHLVLHGYAGCLAGPLAAGSDRIASVVYLSGLIVLPGEAVPDVPGGLPEWGVTAPADLEWAQPRMTPWTVPTQPVSYDPAALACLRQTYIRTTAPPTPVLEPSWQRAREAGWETHELTSGFAAMIAAPRQTARLLEACGPQDALPPVFPASPRIALW